ncbi:endonuclease/exonuclease/phosphatase family protein [Kineobactrum salinum]|uniref:Endonuclease/exonuclease/phosphatase family protein n=1 Tax=Kineobactrum salinum TaxID=2708301 RepID=A0A6C0U079_9GAMM|nr:endonuclease/exonuclease/phosphatase family protein [Kineobactrum salinum]QIB65183.1 endonuclease/exonuclease/phosphatase family protein [Kineobactrum salinum]
MPPSISLQRCLLLPGLAALCLLQVAMGRADVPTTDSCASGLGAATIVEGQPLAGELQVISWNIQKAGNAGWAGDLQRLAPGAQLAFIQEASMQAAIADALPATSHQSFAEGYRRGALVTGVMTLSRAKASLECDLTTQEPWLRTPKATVVTEFPLAGREERLLTVNIHAVNFTLGLEHYRAQLAALDEVLQQHRGPVLIAGDLNTWSGDRLATVTAFMDRHGLKPVTFAPDLRSRVFGQALDHIFIRGLEAGAASVVEVDSSDHNPLLVSLSIPPTRLSAPETLLSAF